MRYEAFISYSHDDEEFAAWIQKALESFRIPGRLVNELGLDSNRFLPMFRDKEELTSSADLTDTLKKALEDSKFLIVVCSPSAAASRWVDDEIALFKSSRRSDRIFCVIVDGDPGDPSSCFPDELQSSEPLAIDFRDGGDNRRTVRLKLAASILGVGLDKLRRRDAQRRRIQLAYQVAGSVAVVALAAGLTFRFATTPPCQDSGRRLAEFWNPDIQGKIRQSFLDTNLPFADDTSISVIDRMSTYANEWVAMHADACAATLVREEQSAQLMDLRMACLDERRSEFSGLIQVFQSSDVQLVGQAVNATSELRGLGQCQDREQLLAAYPLPDSEEHRNTIRDLRGRLADARASLAVGDLETVRGVVDGYLARSEELEFPPLEAEALLLKGATEQQSGRSETAKDALYAAASRAVLGRENELAARSWILLSGLLLENEGNSEEALDVLRLAQSYVAQLQPGHILEAAFHAAHSEILMTTGEFEKRVTELQSAVEISRAANDPMLSSYLEQLSAALSNMHRLDEAQEIADEAIAMAAATFGRRHPGYATALFGSARVATLLGDHELALSLRQEILQISESAYTSAHPKLVDALERVSWSLKETGRYDEAISASERALGIEQSFESPRWNMVSTMQNTLGDIAISQGNYPVAVNYLESALESVRKSGNKPRVALALGNLGNIANRQGDFAAAEQYCRDGLEVDETYLPEGHPEFAYSLSCIGEALIGANKPAEALKPLQRANAVRDRDDVAIGSKAWTRWLLGRALWESGSDKDLGFSYVNFASDVFKGMGPSALSELGDIDDWLARNNLQMD